jgi:predicted transcriptional regulator
MSEQTMARTVSKQWAIDVAKRMKGAKFPMSKEDVQKVLEGLDIGDTHCSALLERMNYPVSNPIDLLHEIAKQTCLNACPPEEAWTVRVTDAMKHLNFPLSKEEAQEKLKGIKVDGKDISQLLEVIEYPLDSPADLLLKLAEKT